MLFIQIFSVVLVIITVLSVILVNHNNCLRDRYCSSFKGTFFATNRKGNSHGKAVDPSTFSALDVLDHSHQSEGVCISRCSEKSAAIPGLLVRLVLLLLSGYVIGYDLADKQIDGKWISLLTHWTLIVTFVYGIVGLAVSLQRVLRSTSAKYQGSAADTETGHNWPWLNRFFHILTSIAAPAQVFIMVFYWVAVYEPDSGVTVNNVIKHGALAVLLCVDVLVSRVPFASYSILALLVYMGVYAIYNQIYEHAANEVLYTAATTTKNSSWPMYILVIVLNIIAFFIVYALAGIRELIIRGRFECCGCCRFFCDCCAPTAPMVTSPAPKQQDQFIKQAPIQQEMSYGVGTYNGSQV